MEAKRLRSATNDFIRENPFDLEPNSLNFGIRIKKPNIYVLLRDTDSTLPAEFPENIIWESSDEDESNDGSEDDGSEDDDEYDYDYEIK